jgi:ABC-2 type transport system permease protein
MAVFDRTYRGYAGELTPPWSRSLVIARYALRDVFRSRLFIAFFVLSLVWPLALVVLVYLKYNLEAVTALQLSQLVEVIAIDETFFRRVLLFPQAVSAALMILFVGPALVSPDLRNNAMPLFLSRPMNKSDYVTGKLVVLAGLASAMTWIPGLLLFVLQSSLAGGQWLLDHLRVAAAVFVGSWVLILSLSAYALAVSAWVKWKAVARLAAFAGIAVFFGVGQVFKVFYETWWGSLFVVPDQILRIWSQLFGAAPFFEIPAPAAWVALGLFTLASTLMLFRRIRAYEVVS